MNDYFFSAHFIVYKNQTIAYRSKIFCIFATRTLKNTNLT